MVYKYSWENFTFPVAADIVGSECERLERENGFVSAGSMVETARDEASPIHALFEWDNEKAGEQWRLQQAKVVLSCLKVEVESDEQEVKKVRAFVNTNPERSKGVYMNVEDALSNYETRTAVIARAKKELNAFLDKYSNIKELDELIIFIKKYIGNVA